MASVAITIASIPLLPLIVPVVALGFFAGRWRFHASEVDCEPACSKELSVGGQPCRVYAFPTGTVTVRKTHSQGWLPEATPYFLRFMFILADWRWAPSLPIWTYVIDHPAVEGLVAIDAGAVPEFNGPELWRGHEVDRWVVDHLLQVRVEEHEALPARMRAAGLDPSDVKSLVLTHQHVDHSGAVPCFPKSDIFTSSEEDANADKIGANQFLWRNSETRICHVEQPDLARPAVDPALPTLDIVRVELADGLQILGTGGHTPGSLSVSLRTDQGTLWFTGDLSFTAESMQPCACTSGIHWSMKRVRECQSALSTEPGSKWFFPSHDRESGRRLETIQ